ncbi:methyl-accepting chemotaxis protein [Bosea sp. (in: a-proteobacteria)]|uniref:methyl-accepting chemotaxis protein n=1 Tax=Bosea sp. (in: a-proteobacteria) TaxID=1871050 RepID=UPI002733841B|nr:methyl-accepting chemotaxis protein [Bosea sp. (in: a-proteobacteria)]MDP3410094.1 methyl-accepting chemotaxis protein [Bosea sp. (in: a-proteobacteria)]
MTSLANRITSLTVGAKIAVIMALMLLPIGHLTLLFVQQVKKDIAFSSLEVTGAKLLGDVWGAVATATSPAASPDRLAAAAQSVTARQPAADALNAGEPMRAFASALAEGRDKNQIWDAGQAAIQRIADASNLTLDPDVDSYYTMDVVTVRLPELVIARAALQAAIQPALATAGKLPPPQLDALIQAATRYSIALASAQSSLASAVAGNTDGSLAAAIAGARGAFDTAAALVGKQAATLREGYALDRPVSLTRTEVDAAAAGLSTAADALWRSAQPQLIRLIQTRIDGFEHRATRDLAIAGFAALVALAFAFVFIRSIRNPLADLVATLRRHEANDYSQPVAHGELRNEIGAIARAIDHGRLEAGRSALTVSAMNQSPTMLMITDPEEKITFISASLLRMLQQLEPSFRQASPDFRVAGMLGQHIDCYRANANLKRQLILDNGQVRKVRYDVADEAIMVDMAYIHDADGRTIGHTLIWRNVTADLRNEAEVAAVVDAARQGDFSARLSVDDKDGFVRDIAIGLNQVSTVVEQSTTDFAQAMQAVASADLTRSVTGEYHGVFATLKDAINETVERLSSTVKTIQLTSVDVGLAAREINTGADDLSKRTEEQASSLEETAATTEQLAASVKASAQASRQAAAVANEAMQAAQTGGAIAGQAVDAMARIESASTKISDIIRVIDDIAFQTNLLALNAAVEAARAGDAGKGFAVVASEVRTLAQRSSSAAKDISALISSSNTEVVQGVKLVRQAGEQLSQILTSSQKVAATIADISAASGEQANGIDEMSQAVAHLDEMTQQNAALSEQSAASAASLSSRIAQLNDLVAAFKTGSDGGHAASYAAPRVAATEPARLRQLAQAAFTHKAPAPRTAAPAPRPAPAAPARKVANSRAGDSGWEEF